MCHRFCSRLWPHFPQCLGNPSSLVGRNILLRWRTAVGQPRPFPSNCNARDRCSSQGKGAQCSWWLHKTKLLTFPLMLCKLTYACRHDVATVQGNRPPTGVFSTFHLKLKIFKFGTSCLLPGIPLESLGSAQAVRRGGQVFQWQNQPGTCKSVGTGTHSNVLGLQLFSLPSLSSRLQFHWQTEGWTFHRKTQLQR